LFRSDGNHLKFQGSTGDDFLPVSAALHNIIHKQGYQDVVFDFLETTYFDPGFMLPLATACIVYRGEKVEFDILLPVDPTLRRLMTNANWAYLIAPDKFDANPGSSRQNLSALQYMSSDDHFKVVNRSMDVILQRSAGLDRSRLKALEWSLNEITDNVLNHAESKVGGIVQVITLPTKRRVEFYVCDAGIGIAKSLRSGRPDIFDDVSAIRAAIQEGVTKNKQTNQGNGLFGTFKCCEVSGGDFRMISRNVQLDYKRQELRVSRNNIPLGGTYIKATINYHVDDLLERALVFKGKPHNPPFDYVERVYQALDDDVTFNVAHELDAFGSRESGRFANNKILNLMDNQRLCVVFDFVGITLI